MGKSLFIAEKPSVAMEFAKALGVSSTNRKDGYIEDDANVITWCVGHLIAMSYPDAYDPELKKWELDTLPFIPKTFKYEVIANVGKQYKTVASLLNRKDISKIYYSGDSAREGEYIQRLVRQHAGHNPNAEEFRVWIDSQTKEEILRGIREAKPLSSYDTLSDSAYARAIEDYLVGMNFSRVLSLKYATLINKAIGTQKYVPIAVGRVMSCVLGMVVNREREIRNAEIFPFYGIRGKLDSGVELDWKIVEGSRFFNDPNAYNGIGLKVTEPVEALIKELNGKGTMTITEVKKSESQKAAPLLFNLAELQGECTKKFHISPSETLEIAQTLYEAKLTTYPRTDARVLTTAMTKVWDHNIQGLTAITDLNEYACEIIGSGWADKLRSKNSKYVDDSKVSDHYAIIPTGEGLESYKKLTELQKEVYLLICKRFLSIFYPPAVITKMQVTGVEQGETFNSTVSVVTEDGYMKVAGKKDDAADRIIMAAMGQLKENSINTCSYEMKQGQSQPPKRYTTGSMILAMENAGNLIDDPDLREQIKGSGIGTSATRAETISKLSRNGYISVVKKTQTIQPTALGEMIFEVLNRAVPQILNPKYTASWESGLSGITEGKVTKTDYLDKIYQYVRGGVDAMKKSDYSEDVKSSISSLSKVYSGLNSASGNGETGITCPICGKKLIHGQKNYYCSGYKEGCKFSIFDTIAGKKISPAIIKELTEGFTVDSAGNGESKPSSKIKGFKKKAGGTFDAQLKLTVQAKQYPKIEFVFK